MNEEFNLTPEQTTEYQTVMLAGLLHDIGKFTQRRKNSGKGAHALFSFRFLQCPEISKIFSMPSLNVDLNLLKKLVLNHHDKGKKEDPEWENFQADTTREKKLIQLIRFADGFSAYERVKTDKRNEDKNGAATGGYKNFRIFSTFSLLNITNQEASPKHYQLSEFSTGHIFPRNWDYKKEENSDYECLIEKFKNALFQFEPENFNDLYTGLLTIFHKYLWAVPSNTWEKKSDISLFDHLSTSSAIAAALYLGYANRLEELKEKVKKEKTFLLVGGDLSGIQDFIFELYRQNPRKLSRTLRGRSFLLSAIVETVAARILKELKLPPSCRLMSSGGRFVILAPNTPWAKNSLEKIALETEREMMRLFLGKLTMSIDYKTEITGQEMAIGLFKNRINDLNLRLIKRKLSKNSTTLKSGEYQTLMEKPHGYSLQDNGPCDFCGVFPAEKAGPNEKCLICNISEELGDQIINAQYFHLVPANDSGRFSFLGHTPKLSQTPVAGEVLASFLVEEPSPEKSFRGGLFHSIANYLPKDLNGAVADPETETENSLCFYCGLKKTCPREDRDIFRRSQLSFQCISAASSLRAKRKCSDKLAVFKADIDNLGHLTQYGFNRRRNSGEFRDIYSVSRFTFLSRMIDAFFQYLLKDFIKNKYPFIYTVYAGGDDMMLVGPWLDILTFANGFQKIFREFVGDNPNITISAGIALLGVQAPVPDAALNAEACLERSKAATGKNSLTVFDTTVKWCELEKLQEFADFLDKVVQDEHSGVTQAFLFRLFKYQRMFMDSERGIVEGLRFHSLMNNDIRRNIKKEKNHQIVNEETLKKLEPLYATGDTLDKTLMKNLKIPLHWALYKNRGGK